MNQGLFESLTGQFLDGTPVDSVPDKSRRLHSIMDNLSRIFNIREGSLPHLPGFGLPDISEVYRKMPGGMEELRDAIKRTVDIYEPRLRNVKVSPREAGNDKFTIVFIISGDIRGGGGMVRFETTFTSTGNSSVKQWKKPE